LRCFEVSVVSLLREQGLGGEKRADLEINHKIWEDYS
jgi:hypothetical protein